MNKLNPSIIMSAVLVLSIYKTVFASEAKIDNPRLDITDRRVMDKEIAECMKDLREIVRDAEASIKKIESEKKAAERRVGKPVIKKEEFKLIVEKREIVAETDFVVMQKAADESAMKAKSEAKRRAEAETVKAKKIARQKAKREAEMARKITRQKAEEEVLQAKKVAKQKTDEEVAMAKLAAQEKAVKIEKKSSELTDIGSLAASVSSVEKVDMAVAQAVPVPIVDTTEEIAALYKDAVDFYWDSKYNDARARFQQIHKLSPDYARTKYYLNRIKEKLAK